MKHFKLWWLIGAIILVVVSNCKNNDGSEFGDESYDYSVGESEFNSSEPGNNNSGRYGGAEEDSADADADTDMSDNANGGEQVPTDREIEEADIIKIDGTTLYALSAYRGLLVVDLSVRDQITALGRFPVYGTPFEMYLKDGVAYIIFSSFWVYEWDEENGYGNWNSTSRVVAVDVSDPQNIREIGNFDLAGQISDSRMVGDIIYLVANENGYCWRCSDKAQTTITSIFAGDPENIRMVDQLSYLDDDQSWGSKSISVNQNRIYVGGPDYTNGRSTIQIVDISDPDGNLTQGAGIEIEGMITNRWQMDEYNGVLRVISQPNSWWWGGAEEDDADTDDNPNGYPVVETFAIRSSTSISRLGRMVLELPTQESLQSVRFDGTRAYAVTFQQTDPLFTIDLSDPANPVQRGELQMPGWLYYMEPRGDRLIALGYDWSDSRSLTMSIFDVSDLDNPIMLSRANFGADWGWMVEDQDRIHKALKILDDQGIILMPFAGWSEEGYDSGVQIFDFTSDTVTLRGVVPHRGYARRSFILNERLFAISDEKIESFDISDRDNPRCTASLTLARSVYRFTPVGQNYLAELSNDWWSREAKLDILDINNPDEMTPVGSLDLSFLRPDNSDPYDYWWGGFDFYTSRIFSKDNNIFIIWGEYNYNYDEDGNYHYDYVTKILVIDASDPQHPRFANLSSFPFRFPYQYGYYYWWTGTIESGENVIQIGNTIAVLTNNSDYYWYYYDESNIPEAQIYLIDISNPRHPVLGRTIEGNEGDIYGTLFAKGNLIVTSHREPQDNGLVRFFMDRIDVSDPQDPVSLPEVNIPGSLIDFNAQTNRIVTVDYNTRYVHSDEYETCYDFVNSWYDWDNTRCVILDKSLNVLTLSGDRAYLNMRQYFREHDLQQVRVTDSKVFLILGRNYYYYYSNETDQEDPRPILSVIPLQNNPGYQITAQIRLSTMYPNMFDAVGDQALITANYPPTLFIYGNTDNNSLELNQNTLLSGYSYDTQVIGNKVISANSMWGVQSIDF